MANQSLNIPNIQVSELGDKGEKIYQKHSLKLEKEHSGKYVAIEIASEDFFIGETSGEALDAAKKRYPDKLFYVRRIGEITKISHHFMPSYGSSIF
ncbi:hypothetical protein A2661_02835 [Candidatus Giovannonibacteria bacterium RIFCSPHIGHO2_01_FULL_45_24]|uniref:DUF5678 domain-containing protein n=1 Tax=Candidatus Giovannonibacteria bacterium RIFCSPLOWO2_01_FULL_46_32 TaxID=1798353 RepID=A0A1F5XGS0_9BACT|nr:MAG: hypothetical protein A2661_02835 [Candidatus Giovannonibacteria bacterium RIFCSPHIGHO2_01_FULL_45_24]OGF87113.1 MAG: hypothetical protein A3B19_00750 [Candidatus Giovannonibacteria bacterium RIFCSPLOWO2_01_FULL_46_32]